MTGQVRALAGLLLRPHCAASRGGCKCTRQASARGAAAVNVAIHRRVRWERHGRAGHASRGPAVAARVARNLSLRIIGGGRRLAGFRSSASPPSLVPTDAGRALGRARPAFFSWAEVALPGSREAPARTASGGYAEARASERSPGILF